jgi:shikimate dehydrogenase
MMRYGLLGEKLGHSYSPFIYRELGIDDYRLFEVAPDKVEPFLRGGDLAGLNVTIPYKKRVLPFCDSLADIARRLGNVNLLGFDDQGRIHGDNADYGGFLYLIRRAGVDPAGKKVLVLGSGGAAQTVILACRDSGARQVVMVSRSGADNYGNIRRHADAQVLVNATPAGMYPQVEETPLGLDVFTSLEAVVDLIYNPLRTKLLLEARKRHIPCACGLPMLVEQGRLAAETFLRRRIPTEKSGQIHAALLRAMENIVLVGMPGCGKSSVAEIVAGERGRKKCDTDEMVKEESGRSPADIIEGDGERAFRRVEGEILRRVARESGLVIATGGGAILDEANRTALRQNGRVYWLDRPLADLALQGRPLSKDLDRLYRQRGPIYQEVADARIDASQGLPEVAQAVMEEFHAHTGA